MPWVRCRRNLPAAGWGAWHRRAAVERVYVKYKSSNEVHSFYCGLSITLRSWKYNYELEGVPDIRPKPPGRICLPCAPWVQP